MILGINTNDRITVALIAALIVHAIVGLAVGFQYRSEVLEGVEKTLDIVLVNWQSEETPDSPDFLAQANQQGGGDELEKVRPTQVTSAQMPNMETGEADANLERSSPRESAIQRQQLTFDESEQQVQQETDQDEIDPADLPSAEQLIQASQKQASMQAELSDKLVWAAKSPRRKFISANTKQYEFASYMQAWVAKIERVGNLNYPESARQRDLSGSLIMTVGINLDGSIESITVKKSSGHKVLDEAAQQIVQIAAPYTPLPPEIAQNIDVLHITRTWRFTQGARLQ